MFKKLDNTLSDPLYWQGDLFMEAQEIISHFDSSDWLELLSRWEEKPSRWIENLLVAISGAETKHAVQLAFAMLSKGGDENLRNGLNILHSLDGSELGKNLGEPQLQELALLWRSQPEHREKIKLVAWGAGKSGTLRKLIGIEHWTEASEFDKS